MSQLHKEPLHGVTLEYIVMFLQIHYGWEESSFSTVSHSDE
jgi:uncharacterized protein (DUF2132 family)